MLRLASFLLALALPLAVGAGTQDLATRLAAHAELGRHTWAQAEAGGLAVAVQTVGAAPPAEQAAELALDLAPRLEALRGAWAELATALELPAAQRAPAFPALVVLGDDRAHQAAVEAIATRAPFAEQAVFDASLGAVVTRVYPDQRLAPERRIAVLRAVAGAWLDGAAGSGAFGPSALREGLAAHLARAVDEGERRAPLARLDAARLAEAARVPVRRLQTLPPAADLWRPRSAQEARTWIYERARQLGLPGAETEEGLECFYAQARVWCDWLGASDDARRRAGWHAYLKGAFSGTHGFDALRAALGVDAGDLEREFLDVVLNAGAKDLPIELVGELVAERATVGATERAAAKDAARGPRGGGFDPGLLAPSALDPRVQLALALAEAREGALEAAIARLDEVLPISAATSDGERAARARERLAAIASARRAWAETAATAGARFSRELDGKRTTLKVERFADGVLHLAKNKAGLERLPLEALRPVEVLGSAKDLPPDTPAWVPAWTQLLDGDERWARALDEVPEREALEAEAADVPALLALGASARALQRLSRLELQGGALAPDTAEDTIAELSALVAAGGDLVEGARPELVALANLAFGARHDALGGIPGLAGRSGPGPAGSVRVLYGFDDPAEANDWVLDTEAMPDWHASMTPVPKAAEASYFVLRQGAFFGDGQLVYRHRMRFQAPVRVKYQMRYVPRQEDPLDVGVVFFGLGETPRGTFAAASEFGDVYCTDPTTGHNARTLFEGERVVAINTIYTCEARLEPDGEGFVIEAWREGSLRNELPAQNCDGGGLFFFVHTPRIVAFEEIAIEGVPEPGALAELRQAWIDEQRAAIGL